MHAYVFPFPLPMHRLSSVIAGQSFSRPITAPSWNTDIICVPWACSLTNTSQICSGAGVWRCPHPTLLYCLVSLYSLCHCWEQVHEGPCTRQWLQIILAAQPEWEGTHILVSGTESGFCLPPYHESFHPCHHRGREPWQPLALCVRSQALFDSRHRFSFVPCLQGCFDL